MTSLCPHCDQALPPTARLCTHCGFNLQTGRLSRTLVEHKPPPNRVWLKILLSPWLQLLIPAMVMLVGWAMRPGASGPRQANYDWAFFCFYFIYGGALVIIAAFISYFRTRHDDAPLIRIRGFGPALLHSGLPMIMHILGYVLVLAFLSWRK